MDDLKTRFLNSENFYLAFKRVKYYFLQSNEWYDPIELAAYEANLSTNISLLIKNIENEKYSPHPIEPLPFPKKSKKNEIRIRQYFKINIEDQIVWIAIINVVGRFLEVKMPFWSYGNRLFRPVWFKDNKLERGSYLNSSQHFYRKWNQSWPFYRRHISMTIKTMAFNKRFTKEKLADSKEIEIYEQELNSEANEYIYLDENFWEKKKNKRLYWIGLDYKKFFPSLRPEKIIENFERFLIRSDGTSRDDRDLIISTAKRMLKFPINTEGWSLDDLDKVSLSDRSEFHGVPTGLFAAGFLANVVMLEVDTLITEYIKNHKNIAIFKYVDDQVILSNSKDSLRDFLRFYHNALISSGTGVAFQEDKVCPSAAYKYTDRHGFEILKEEDADSSELDIEFPEPLMTHTLQKMSNLNEEDYDLEDSVELDKSTDDLEHFLLADFPDTEMRKDTRMAFAAMKLCQVAKAIKPDFKKIDDFSLSLTIHNEGKRKKTGQGDQKLIQRFLKREIKLVRLKHQRIFKLLVKAVNENPDKLKLWKRSLEFCFQCGFSGINKVLNLIDHVELSSKSKDYIRAYCMLIISELRIKAYNVLHEDYLDFWKNQKSTEFIRSISELKIDFSNEAGIPSFIKSTNKLFQLIEIFVHGQSYPEILHARKIDSSASEFSLNDNTYERSIWFLLSSLYGNSKYDLWFKSIDNIDFSNPISWSIFSLYPGKIPLSVFEKMRLEFNKKNDTYFEKTDYMNESGGFLFEIFESNKEIREKWLKEYPVIEDALNYDNENYISLFDWFKQIKKISSKDNWTDPRLSEWSLLEIIKQIAAAIKNKNQEVDIFDSTFLRRNERYKVHPANYLIPKSWLLIEKNNVTWDSWKSLVNTDKIKIISSKLLIDDFRYLPISKQWKTTGYGWFFGNGEFTTIVQLSVLMIQLLSKSLEWPPTVNKIQFMDQLFSRAIHTIEKEPVSSETRFLLSVIFSKKDIDFFMGHKSFDLDEKNIIKNLNDFQENISKIQLELLKGQLSLINNAPRQLTIIDLDKLNDSKNIF